MKQVIPVFFLLLSFSCNKEILSSHTPKGTLTGTWVKLDDKSTGSIKTFIKKDTFDEHQFGYSFHEGNKLTVRVKIACGKPPVYGNVQGTYSRSNDDKLHLNYKVSGRPNEFNLKILKLTTDTLKLEY
jgi:hypothetical protein